MSGYIDREREVHAKDRTIARPPCINKVYKVTFELVLKFCTNQKISYQQQQQQQRTFCVWLRLQKQVYKKYD